MGKETDEAGRQQQRHSKEVIEQAILDLVRESPDDFTADDVRVRLGQAVLADPGFRSEMMGGAFSALAQRKLIKSLGSRTSQAPGMKNRRVTVYAATPKLRIELGLEEPVSSSSPATSHATAPAFLNALFDHTQANGVLFELADLTNIFLCLQAKPFVILSGISGTGKSLLPRLLADALGAKFTSIPIKPNWNENSYLMGYYSIPQDDFLPGPMMEAILDAAGNADVPSIVRLDEMNLAHVEHYFSDLLSVMEDRWISGEQVVSEALPLDLPAAFAAPTEAKKAKLEALRSTTLPWNLFIIGTVNVDETTYPFSRKVLDRSFAVEFSNVDLTAFATTTSGASVPFDGEIYRKLLLDRPLSIRQIYAQQPEFFQDMAGRLQEINSVLMSVDLHFGYRVRDEVCLYMWAWRRHALNEVLSEDEAFDYCILQKVLPRCHGTSDAARRTLEQIFYITAGVPAQDFVEIEQLDELYPVADRRYRRSSEKVARMLRQYRDAGFFSFWNS